MHHHRTGLPFQSEKYYDISGSGIYSYNIYIYSYNPYIYSFNSYIYQVLIPYVRASITSSMALSSKQG